MNDQEYTALESQPSGINAIIEVAQQAKTYQIIDVDTSKLGHDGMPKSVPLLYRPSQEKVISIADELKLYANKPHDRRGKARAANLESFIQLVNYHKIECSVIFAESNMPSPHLIAVIDYHSADHKANNLKHKIHYDFPVTDEYRKWLSQSGNAMSQSDFALFLDHQIVELASPTEEEIALYCGLFHKKHIAEPTEMLELAKNLEINVQHNVKNGNDVTTGEKTIIFTETHENAEKNKDGDPVEVPSLFMVSVPAFVDGDHVRIPARLSYKISRGQIEWTYELFRPNDLLKQQVKTDLQSAITQTTLIAFEGTPES